MSSLIYPMFSMVVITAIVLMVSTLARFRAVKSGQLRMGYFKMFTGGNPPDDVTKASNHFKNLFEVPVLFYAGCLAAMIIRADGPLITSCAWIFITARIAHAIIHIGSNKLRPRMLAYGLGWLAIVVMWSSLALSVLPVNSISP